MIASTCCCCWSSTAGCQNKQIKVWETLLLCKSPSCWKIFLISFYQQAKKIGSTICCILSPEGSSQMLENWKCKIFVKSALREAVPCLSIRFRFFPFFDLLSGLCSLMSHNQWEKILCFQCTSGTKSSMYYNEIAFSMLYPNRRFLSDAEQCTFLLKVFARHANGLRNAAQTFKTC